MMDDPIIGRFRERQGALMLLAALEGKPAIELFQSNPCLGFCLALNWEFLQPPVPMPMTAARELLRRRQREILEWLRFPGTEAFAKLTRKVLPESVSVNRCLQLRDAVGDDGVAQMLSHLPRINSGVLALVGRKQFHTNLTPRLLAEVADAASEDVKENCARTLEDTYHMAQLLNLDPPSRPIPSWKRLELLHESLVCEVNEREIPGYRGHDLPTPPLRGLRKGAVKITPIRCTEQLNQLGREQHNCVASYASRIKEGHVFIYRVTTPWEVCTLAITPGKKGSWEINDLRGVCNCQPHPSTRRIVREWLSPSEVPATNRVADSVDRSGGQHSLVAAAGHAEIDRAPIAPVPVPGMAEGEIEITPVTDRRGLVDIFRFDGSDFRQRCRHVCVGSLYAYRVKADGDDLTLLIKRTSRARWRVQELRTSTGESPRGATLAAVADWLGRSQGLFR